MTTKNRSDESEKIPQQPDIQSLEVFTTPNGDKIQAVVIGQNRVMLTGVGKLNEGSIILPDEVPSVSYNKVWDAIAGAAKILIGVMTKGVTCTPVTETTVTTHKNGTVTINTKTRIECRPA